MDIAFTPEQDTLRQEFRIWLAANLPTDVLPPNDEDADASAQAAWERKLCGADYSGVAWPTKYGGRGLSIVGHFVVAEELGLAATPEGMVRTDPDAVKHKSITLLLLDMETPGIKIPPLTQITGRQEFNELLLEDVIVSDANRLGAVNDGWQFANNVLSFERATNRLDRQGRFTHEFRVLLRLCATQDAGITTAA